MRDIPFVDSSTGTLAPQPAIDPQSMHMVHLAAALVALVVPILSVAFLFTGPALLVESEAYTHVVLPAVFGANLANLILFVGVCRARVGPDRFRDLLSIGGILSGICVSVVAVLGGIFSTLG